ncbi:MAG: D-alanyl-D-alanine carboxypeptidase [Desulfobulbaceae bacterium]|nr:D-alanyl-D-alanine carboxypeptidase [Desulfobulbaceae bacterium]
MRFLAVRICVVLVLLSVVFPASDLLAKSRTVSKRSVHLSSRHKFTPEDNNGGAKTARTAIRLTNGQKEPARATTAARPAEKSRSRWASLPIDEKLSAQSAIIMDGATGEVLFAQNPDLARQPASTIKVLTGLLAIENLRDGEMITPSRRAAGQPRSKIYLDPRKSYTANDLINAVLLASANDASVALAEKVGGSERAFAAMMTAKARSLGASNTICKTATGLTSEGQQSTARDLALIFNKAMEGSEFAFRVGRPKVKTVDGKLLLNHNKALWQVHGAEGGKTGYTNVARQTYVGKFKREQGEVVIALMGSETMWADVKNLVEYGFAQQESRQKDAVNQVAGVDNIAERIAAIRRSYAVKPQQASLRVLVADSKNSRL